MSCGIKTDNQDMPTAMKKIGGMWNFTASWDKKLSYVLKQTGCFFKNWKKNGFSFSNYYNFFFSFIEKENFQATCKISYVKSLCSQIPLSIKNL